MIPWLIDHQLPGLRRLAEPPRFQRTLIERLSRIRITHFPKRGGEGAQTQIDLAAIHHANACPAAAGSEMSRFDMIFSVMTAGAI
jgi:hypothetical protein